MLAACPNIYSEWLTHCFQHFSDSSKGGLALLVICRNNVLYQLTHKKNPWNYTGKVLSWLWSFSQSIIFCVPLFISWTPHFNFALVWYPAWGWLAPVKESWFQTWLLLTAHALHVSQLLYLSPRLPRWQKARHSHIPSWPICIQCLTHDFLFFWLPFYWRCLCFLGDDFLFLDSHVYILDMLSHYFDSLVLFMHFFSRLFTPVLITGSWLSMDYTYKERLPVEHHSGLQTSISWVGLFAESVDLAQCPPPFHGKHGVHISVALAHAWDCTRHGLHLFSLEQTVWYQSVLPLPSAPSKGVPPSRGIDIGLSPWKLTGIDM